MHTHMETFCSFYMKAQPPELINWYLFVPLTVPLIICCHPVTLAGPPTCCCLKITRQSFRCASSNLWNLFFWFPSLSSFKSLFLIPLMPLRHLPLSPYYHFVRFILVLLYHVHVHNDTMRNLRNSQPFPSIRARTTKFHKFFLLYCLKNFTGALWLCTVFYCFNVLMFHV